MEGDRNDEKSEKEEVEGGREWRGWSALCRVPESGRPISTGPGWGCGLSSRSGSGEGRMDRAVSLVLLRFPFRNRMYNIRGNRQAQGTGHGPPGEDSPLIREPQREGQPSAPSPSTLGEPLPRSELPSETM